MEVNTRCEQSESVDHEDGAVGCSSCGEHVDKQSLSLTVTRINSLDGDAATA